MADEGGGAEEALANADQMTAPEMDGAVSPDFGAGGDQRYPADDGQPDEEEEEEAREGGAGAEEEQAPEAPALGEEEGPQAEQAGDPGEERAPEERALKEQAGAPEEEQAGDPGAERPPDAQAGAPEEEQAPEEQAGDPGAERPSDAPEEEQAGASGEGQPPDAQAGAPEEEPPSDAQAAAPEEEHAPEAGAAPGDQPSGAHAGVPEEEQAPDEQAGAPPEDQPPAAQAGVPEEEQAGAPGEEQPSGAQAVAPEEEQAGAPGEEQPSDAQAAAPEEEQAPGEPAVAADGDPQPEDWALGSEEEQPPAEPAVAADDGQPQEDQPPDGETDDGFLPPDDQPAPPAEDSAASILSDGEDPSTADEPPEAGMNVDDQVPRGRVRPRPESAVSLSRLPPLGTTAEQDADSQNLYNQYLKHGRLPPPDTRAQLIQHIQRLKVNALVAQRFDDAHTYQSVLTELQDRTKAQDIRERNSQRLDVLDTQLNDAQAQIAALQKETTRVLKEHTEKQRERRQELLARQEKEFAEFSDHWNDPEHLRKFAKPSSQLLMVKKTERSMILAKVFDQADVFRRRVRELEKQESELAQKRAYMEMAKQREKLIAKHELELTHFDQHCAKLCEQIRQEQEVKKAAIEARQAKLSSEVEAWRMNPPTALPLMAAAILPKAVMTPRTAQRYAAFKKVAKPPVVKIQPLGNVKPPKRRRPATAQSL
jgi:hypothetical protein